MLEETKYGRRRFLSNAAMTTAAFDLLSIASAFPRSEGTKSADTNRVTTGTNTAFDELKQTEAGVLSVDCFLGQASILLRGIRPKYLRL